MKTSVAPFAKTSNMTPFRLTQVLLVELPGVFTVHVGAKSADVGRRVVGRFDGLNEGLVVGLRMEGMLVVGLAEVGVNDVGPVVVGLGVVGFAVVGLEGLDVGAEPAGCIIVGLEVVGSDVVGVDVGVKVEVKLGLYVGLGVGLDVGLGVGLDVGGFAVGVWPQSTTVASFKLLGMPSARFTIRFLTSAGLKLVLLERIPAAIPATSASRKEQIGKISFDRK